MMYGSKLLFGDVFILFDVIGTALAVMNEKHSFQRVVSLAMMNMTV